MDFDNYSFVAIFAIIVNFVSDILGQYENLLYLPFYRAIINDEEREEYQAFKQATQTAVGVVSQGLGGILILVLSYKILAIFNATTFLISLLLIKTMKIELIPTPSQTVKTSVGSDKISLRSIIADITTSIKLLTKIGGLKEVLVSIPFLNGCTAIIYPTLLFLLSSGTYFRGVTQELIISVFFTTSTLGSIAGGYLTSRYLKKLSIESVLILDILSMIILFLFLLTQSVILVILGLFFLHFFNAVINPKLGAKIINSIPESSLGSVFGGMVTYFSIGDIISRMLFSMLVVILPLPIIIIVYIISSVLILSYVISTRVKGFD